MSEHDLSGTKVEDPPAQNTLEAVLQDWRLHVLPWEHEMVFDEPEEEEEDELEDSERR